MANFQEGDLVWAKLRGYPWWPAKVKSFEQLPELASINRQKNGIPVFFYGSIVAKDNLEPFQQNLEKRKKSGSASLLEAIKECENHENIVEPPIFVDSGDEDTFVESSNEVVESPVKQKKEKLESVKEKKEKHEPVAKEKAAKTEKPLKRPKEEKEAISSLEKKAKKEAVADKPKKKENLEKVSGKSEIRDIVKSIDSKRSGKPVSVEKKDDRLESLYSLRGTLQKILCRADFKPEEFPMADKALSQLEKVEVDLELFKSTGIGRLAKALSKQKLPENEYNFSSRFKNLIGKWREFLKQSDELQKMADVSKTVEESKKNAEITESKKAEGAKDDVKKAAEGIARKSKETGPTTKPEDAKKSKDFEEAKSKEMKDTKKSAEEKRPIETKKSVETKKSLEENKSEANTFNEDIKAKKNAGLITEQAIGANGQSINTEEPKKKDLGKIPKRSENGVASK